MGSRAQAALYYFHPRCSGRGHGAAAKEAAAARRLPLVPSLPRALQQALNLAGAPDPEIFTRAVKNKYKNTVASPAYCSENYCTTEGAAI